ncbi:MULTISPECIES: hypothetical protein [unclassified Mammaliicoccus]|nr:MULTISPECIES: hypothetical protein [unclassified Mammaliicoccus]HDF4598089.1 hypothetical protein [Staphylococcus aureus]HDF5118360.1 hypothetical protein [Staphylococcus aureus]HDF5119090.1 hypothetical protein [Staphylococcus aureus]
MNKQSLTEKIKSLINLKYEGSYWDFKKEHHTNDLLVWCDSYYYYHF